MRRALRSTAARWKGKADSALRQVRRASRSGARSARRSATAGLPFDDVDFESRLVWIYGSPRTGSTWLLQQLCDPLRLDDTSPQGFRGPKGAGKIDALPVSEFLVSSHVAPALGDPVEKDGELLPATLNNYLGHKPSYLFARDYDEVWRPAIRRLILVRLYAVQAAASEAGFSLASSPSMIIKEVNGSHAADLVMSILPRSRVLLLVRDGRDVVDSLLHAVQEGGWLAQQGYRPVGTSEERFEWVRSASYDWACGIDASRRAYDAHAPHLRTIVRYEDLVAEPQATLRGLSDWAGLDRSDERLERIAAKYAFAAIPEERRGPGEKSRAASPGLWRENLTPAEKEATGEIMGDRLDALGYVR